MADKSSTHARGGRLVSKTNFGIVSCNCAGAVTFSSDFRPLSFLSVLSSCISISFPLSLADYIELPLPFLLSFIPSIVDHPWYYLVADSLLLYQCHGSYLVQYITSQSGGTVGLGLCPLRLFTLLA